MYQTLYFHLQSTYTQLTGPKPPPAPTYVGNLLMSTKLSCCCGVWLVDNFHGSESTWKCGHEKTKKKTDGLVVKNKPIKWEWGDFSSNLFEKWRVNTKVFGHYVKAEEVTIDTRTSHGQTIHVLMLLCRFSKQCKSLCILVTQTAGKTNVLPYQPFPCNSHKHYYRKPIYSFKNMTSKWP